VAPISRDRRIPRHRGDGFEKLRIRATQQVVTGGTFSRNRVGSGAAAGEPRTQGLKILQREVTFITARYIVPYSRTEWSWDCSTPHLALAETSVSASAIVRLRESAAERPCFSDPTCHPVTVDVHFAHPHHRGLRGQASEPDQHGLGAL